MNALTPSLIVDRLPYELQARAEADGYFADIPVVVAEEGNVRLMLEKKQAVMRTKSGRWGVAVVVLQVAEEDFRPNLQFGPMRLLAAFQVIEMVEQNQGKTGTKKSYRQVARRLITLFKGTLIEGLTHPMKAGTPAIEPVSLTDLGANVRGCQVNLEALESASERTSQVALPAVSAYAGDVPQVQIACATAGAAIYFTTDDSYPIPPTPGSGATSRLYQGPINIPAGGFVVRACAYAEGMVASSVVRKLISVEAV